MPTTAWTMRPVATHAFFNLRTYVRCPGCRAIYFLAEWIPNRLAIPSARDFTDSPSAWPVSTTRPNDGRWRKRWNAPPPPRPRDPSQRSFSRRHGAEHFLVRAYTAFTCRNDRSRRFDIRHAPWNLAPADVAIETDNLVAAAAPWFAHARDFCLPPFPGRPQRREMSLRAA